MNIRNIANETNPNQLYGGNAQEVQQNNPGGQQEQIINQIQEDTYTPTDEAQKMLEQQRNPEARGNEQNTQQNVIYEENPNTQQTPVSREVRTAEEPAERIEDNPEREEQQNRTRQQTETARAANPTTANQNRTLDLLA
ncbi:hypothetical protein ACFL1R_11605 [Candidatus Latescibacterota bacterium]